MKTAKAVAKATVVLLVIGLNSQWALSQATCPTAPGRFAATGGEVLDRYSGLVWRRCSQGQTWSGTDCTGTATTHTHEQAMIVAGQAIGGWRLPNIRELSSLSDFGCYSTSQVGLAAIDRTAFPRTPRAFTWSTTPSRVGTSTAWGVSFDEGNAVVRTRINAGHVRLVRSSP
jgi:hypothetical protein